MPLTITSAPRQLSDGNAAGTILGQSPTDLIGFYGATPQPQILQGTLKGALGLLNIYNTATLSPSAVGANTSAEKQMTVTGVLAADMVTTVVKPTTQAGLIIGSARVSAANTIQVTFANDAGTTVTPTAAESYLVVTVPAAFQLSATLTPLSVASETTMEQQFTVAGVLPGMSLSVSKPSLNAGLVVSGCRVVAANTVGITFTNVSTGTLTPTASEVYLFFASVGLRPQPPMEQILATLAPVSVASQTSAEQTFTVAGLQTAQPVFVNKPTITTGLTVGGARVSAVNTLAINFANAGNVAITPPAEVYLISYFPNAAPGVGSVTAVPAVVGADPGTVDNTMGLTG